MGLRGSGEELPLRRPGWCPGTLPSAVYGWVEPTSARHTGAATGSELVARMVVVGTGVRVQPLGRQLGQRTLDLTPDPTEGDPEDALAAGQQVDDLVRRGAHVHRGAVAHQRDLGQVIDST